MGTDALKNKAQSKKYKVGIPCGDDLVKCSSSGLIPSGLTLRVLWPRRESSRARPRPSLAFRRGARLLPSGWPRRESNPDLAFRKRLFYPLNYSANISTLYSIISTLPLAYTHHYAPSSGFPPASSGKSAYVYLLTCP